MNKSKHTGADEDKSADEVTHRAKAVSKRLAHEIPTVLVELDHANPWQLLIATILSAQSNDKTINRVTPALFAAYPTPEALAMADQSEAEAIVKPTGFFRNKARAIRETSRVLVEEFKGVVPRTMPEILTLPGVARKTANVVLGIGYGVAAGVVVDTHVGRVARRLELTAQENPTKVERDLMDCFPSSAWIATGTRMVLHGRYVCLARAPACGRCCLNELCPSAEAPAAESWTARADAARGIIESRGAETSHSVVPTTPG
ncbi:MAG: endonuclease III [Deltaproteobacteria bacterium]|nr:endonuclease III [Deltaproteobacteria bacterium]